jgi:hypothetical protein
MIRLGRRLTSRDRSARPDPKSEPAVDRPEHPVSATAQAHLLAATVESTDAATAETVDPTRSGQSPSEIPRS